MVSIFAYFDKKKKIKASRLAEKPSKFLLTQTRLSISRRNGVFCVISPLNA